MIINIITMISSKTKNSNGDNYKSNKNGNKKTKNTNKMASKNGG